MRTALFGLFAALATFGFEARAAPVYSALDAPTSFVTTTNSADHYGFRFFLNADIILTRLGVLDFGENGLGTGVDVKITDLLGVPIALATISASVPEPPLEDGFRYIGIGDTFLAGGEEYLALIQGGSAIAGYLAGTTALNIDPAITLLNSIMGNPPHADPSAGFAGQAFVGPNFEFRLVAVPEPSSLALMLPLLLAARAARRARSAPKP
jgi:hypothetical protein